MAEEQWRRATDNRDFELGDEPISDEEMEQIISEPSPLDIDSEENYHRSFFDGLGGLDDHPF